MENHLRGLDATQKCQPSPNPVAEILALLSGFVPVDQNEILISVAKELTDSRLKTLAEMEVTFTMLKETTDQLSKRNGL